MFSRSSPDSCAYTYMSLPRGLHRLGIPILSTAPTTSTSSQRAVISVGFPFSTAAAAAAFFVWMNTSELRKCRVIASGVCTPSSSPGGARCAGCTSGVWMLSIEDVMSSTRLLTNFGVTLEGRIRVRKR